LGCRDAVLQFGWLEHSCCGLRLIGCNIGASYDARADSSAGRHHHANRCRLRRWKDTS
jgi:hypothetical protein